ncbi:hypothetical protein HYQ46_010262 [Verticillium longisporum]|nr:hypothetical protein HYQ46_010262 [Verticillium longisporum]
MSWETTVTETATWMTRMDLMMGPICSTLWSGTTIPFRASETTGLATKTARRGKPTVVDDSDASENMNDVGNEFDEVDDDDLQPRGQPSRHNLRRTVIDESDEDSY